MAEPTIQLGGGNWAGKTDNLLGYYKEGERFYKQDFTFSRSTTGTYTDKDGYIQEMPYNLLTYSEDLTNTYSRTNSTITSGQSGYNGTNDAWLFDVSVAGGNLRKNISVIGDNNFSIYAKKGSANGVRIRFDQDTDTNVYIDLTDGSVFTSANTLSVNVDSIGNGWYRINFSFVALGLILFRIYTTDGTTTTTTGSIFLQSPQLVKGTSAKTYFPTTTRLNMPRVDYLNNSNGSLILEPQRTNLIAQSSAFDNAYWTKSNSSVVSGFTSPDGTANAFKLVENTSTSAHNVFRNSSTVTLAEYSFSCFVKTNGRNVKLDFFGGTNNAIFNLTTGVVISTNGTGLTAKIETLSNGWYRCSINQVQTSTTIYPNILCVDGSNNSTYTGDGSSGIYIYGAQLEAGSYPTTLINTSGSSVTRNADVCSITNAADRIGQTEGTLFLDIDFINIGAVKVLLSIHDGASNKRLEIWSNGLEINGFIGGSVNIAIGNTTISEGRHKLALAYNQSGDQAFYVDGVQIGTSNTVYTIAALTELSYGIFSGSSVYAANGNINNTKIYNTRLSNSELATLTT